MGLLDSWGSWSQDADKNASINQGLLAMGLNLLNSKGSFGNAIGQAGLAGMDAQRASYVGSQADKMRKQQMEAAQLQIQAQQQAEEQRKRQQAFLQGLPSPWQQAGQQAFEASGKPLAMNGPAPQVDPLQSQLFGAMKAGVIDYPAYLAATRKDTSPVKLGAGEQLLDPKTFRPIATNAKPEDKPSAIREYEFAKSQGYPGTFEQWTLTNKRAGATNVSVSTEKNLLGTVAQGLGKQIDDSLGAARSAATSIQNAQSLKAAVDSGRIVTGPGASFRVMGLQLGQMLGVGGKDGAETLANTRQAIQSMAKAELDAAQLMKGQGQITEAERDIIRRAAAGDIDKLTAPEVKLLAESMEKTARFKIKQHQTNVQALQNMPGAAPLLPFYQVDEPPAYTQPAVRRYNPTTGRLE